MTDPADFYTGLVADLYSMLRGHDPDPAPYARFIAFSGEPALELGCGDGDPLLDLLELGLRVEGLDSSSDMLGRCRARAVERGLEPILHHATFQTMDLERRFRSIFLAGSTFNLLPDDATAEAALGAVVRHLDDGGMALIPLFIPTPVDSPIGSVRAEVGLDGATNRCTVLSVERDDAARTQRTLLRYERQAGATVRTLDREWLVHWHTQDAFADLAAKAGLDVQAVLRDDGTSAGPDDDQFTFLMARTRA